MHLDCAAGGVTAVQGALRTTQHFDAIEFNEITGQQSVIGHLPDAVQVDTHVGDAAHVEAGAGRAAVVAGQQYVRHHRTQVFQTFDVLLFQIVATNGRDSRGHVLHIQCTSGGSDDDLGQLRRALRECGLGKQAALGRNGQHHANSDFIGSHE